MLLPKQKFRMKELVYLKSKIYNFFKDKVFDLLAFICFYGITITIFSLPYLIPAFAFAVTKTEYAFYFYLTLSIFYVLFIIFFLGYLMISLYRQDCERVRRCVDGIIIPLGAGVIGTITCWVTGIFQNL